MNITKALLVTITLVVTSCYFFPFVLAIFPIANSKMILAAFGLVILFLNLAKKRHAGVDFDFISLTLWALLVSLITYAAITVNNTPDDTFAIYFISMWVWLGGAYSVVMLIKYVHGEVTVPLVVNYLLAVCVMQCVLALIFNCYAAASEWYNSIFVGESYMGNVNGVRLHGIGCALDVAGFRFSVVICMIAFLLGCNREKALVWIYIVSICFISIVGNMISRSTTIGSVIACAFIIYITVFVKKDMELVTKLSVIVVLAVSICIFLYTTNLAFKQNLRFGFEGFFSLAETGEWQTNSNDILWRMVVWPDNLKTWLIGDGYMNNPADKFLDTYDPYFVGNFHGYYMETDIGYLRYIFYFGVVGLVVFCIFFIQTCRVLCRRFPTFKCMFLLVLVVNFIQWFKVSSDLFVVFALFLCIHSNANGCSIGKADVENGNKS